MVTSAHSAMGSRGAVSIRPFAPGLDQRRANSRGTLSGLAIVLSHINSALPQLYATEHRLGGTPLLVAVVSYDAWELMGIDLHHFVDILAEVLQWDPRLSVAVHVSDDWWFYGRDHAGKMAAFSHFKPWADHLAS
jgi:hypothetical protein